MSVTRSCDSCGAQETRGGEPFETRGFVATAEYCLDCIGAIDALQTEIDEVHTEIVRAFGERTRKLREAWHADHPGGVLPDEDPE